MLKRIQEIITFIDEQGLYPDLPVIDGKVDTIVEIEGKPIVMFASNNYLGLATHPEVVQAAKDAIDTFGVGSGGSRLLSGNLSVHKKLEEALVDFKGGEDAAVWPTGYSTNIGVISAIMNPIKIGASNYFERKSILLSDELNHASIIDGAIMGKAKKVVYRHSDMHHLEVLLKKYKNRRKMIVTDGVFSMDGDIALLDKISVLAKKYGAVTMVDEAHATGTIGPEGRGTLSHFGLKAGKDIDIVMGTFSKALASAGGFIVGSKDLIRYLRVASRSYMFSAAMPPASSASIVAALSVIKKDATLREKLIENTIYFRNGLHDLGFHTFGSTTQIIPILIGTDEHAIVFSRKLREKGFYAPAVRWPAVEKGKARIRLTVMSTHTTEQMSGFLQACKEVLSELSFTPPVS